MSTFVPPDALPREPRRYRYRNWKGVVRVRTLAPLSVWFGRTEFHPDEGYLVRCYDFEDKKVKDFALDGFLGQVEGTPPGVLPVAEGK